MASSKPLHFVTLGPAGSNHELATERYIAFHKLDARVSLIDDFFDGLRMMHAGQADHMVQVAGQTDCADVVARAHFDCGIHIIDTCISLSKDLAILTRSNVETPGSLALQPATRGYTDISRWPDHIAVSSIMRIAEGLLDGTYESDLTTLELAHQNPGRFRIDATIETVDDAWLVFGKSSVANGKIVVWPDNPGTKMIRG